MALDPVGVQLVVEDLATFVQQMNLSARSVTDFAVSAASGAQAASQATQRMFDTMLSAAKQIAQEESNAAVRIALAYDQEARDAEVATERQIAALNKLAEARAVSLRARSVAGGAAGGAADLLNRQAEAAAIKEQEAQQAALNVKINEEVQLLQKIGAATREEIANAQKLTQIFAQQTATQSATGQRLFSRAGLATGLPPARATPSSSEELLATPRLSALINEQRLAAEQAAAAHQLKTSAINQQTGAEGQAVGTGTSFLSLLSGIHAASFLVANQTVSTGSAIATLAISFGRVSVAAGAIAAGVGVGILALTSLTNAFQQIEQVAVTAGEALAKTGALIAGALVAAGAASVKLSADVEQSIVIAGAAAGASGAQVQQLNDSVVGVSRNLGVSAKDASNAAVEFTQAGGDISDAVNGGVQAIETLQVVSRGDLGANEASRTIIGLANQFHISASEAADAITQLAQTTVLNFPQITQAFRQIGPAAAELGIPLKDVQAAIGLVAQELNSGTISGTSLKQVFLDLEKPSAKAAVLLEANKISLFDVNHETRPLVDVFNDLSNAFGANAVASGKVSQQASATAIATIFGARAGIAANIIAKEGAGAFNELEASMQGITANGLLAQTLGPLNSQLTILKANVEAAGLAFGGPLNSALGSALTSVNNFLKGIDLEPFKVLGEAIVALASGSGFGLLEAKLHDLTSNQQIIDFVNGVAGVLLTVRATVESAVVPALERLGQTFVTIASNANFVNIFQTIADGAAILVTGVGLAIDKLDELVQHIANNDQVGQNLRNTIIGLATAAGTTLVGGFVLAAIPIITVINIMESFGQAVLEVIPDIDRFANVFQLGMEVIKTTANDALKSIAPNLRAIGEVAIDVANAINNLGDPTKALSFLDAAKRAGEAAGAADVANTRVQQVGQEAATKATKDHIQVLQDEANFLNAQKDAAAPASAPQAEAELAIRKVNAALQDEQAILAALNNTQASKDQVTQLATDVDAARTLIEKAKDAGPLTIQDFFDAAAGGGVTDFLSQFENTLGRVRGDVETTHEDTTDAGFLPNPGKQQQIADKIVELAKNANVKIQNIEEDNNTRLAQLAQDRATAAEDSVASFLTAVDKIDRKLAQSEQDEHDQLNQTRKDRTVTQDESQSLEDQKAARQEFIDEVDLLQSQADERDATRRQRKTQDIEQDEDQRKAGQERAFQESQEISDRAFQESQQTATRAFTEQQTAEEKALKTRLDAEATARKNAQQLAAAKTPQERAQVTANQLQAADDAKFAKGQQDQLDALKKRQAEDTLRHTQTITDQEFAHRKQSQINEFNFRVAQEIAFTSFKRGLEDREITDKEAKEAQDLLRRFGQQRGETLFGRDQAKELQGVQDGLADQSLDRQIARNQRNAQEQKDDLGTSLVAKLFKDYEQFEKDRRNLSTTTNKQIRSELDEIGRTSDEITKENKGVEPAALTALLASIRESINGDAGLRSRITDSSDRVSGGLDNVLQTALNAIHELLPQVDISNPTSRSIIQRFIPSQEATTAISQAVSVTLPTNYSGMVAEGVYVGLVTAKQQGVIFGGPQSTQVTIQQPTLPTVPQQILELLRNVK